MYDIKNLNIWKASSKHSIFKYRNKVLKTEVSKRRETIMSEKCQNVFDEILTLVPTTRFSEIKKNRGGRLRFPIYISEKLYETEIEALDLSVRSSNCLHRAGYRTICKCQYKNAQKVENKNVHFPVSPPQIVSPKRLAFP